MNFAQRQRSQKRRFVLTSPGWFGTVHGVKKSIALAFGLVLLSASAARAESSAESTATVSTQSSPRRGWLTATGIGLTAAGVAAGVFGIHFTLDAAEATRNLEAYAPTGGVPEGRNGGVFKTELDRASLSTSLSTVLLISAGVAAVGGIALIILDTFISSAPVVSFAPTQGGGALVISGHF